MTDLNQVTALDLTTMDDNTRRMSGEAIFAARIIDQRLADLDYMCEFDMVDGSAQEAQEMIGEMQESLAQLRDSLVEQISVNSALLATMRALVTQRDRALDERMGVDDLADLVSDAQYCSPDDAKRLLNVLMSSDGDLLAADVILDHEWLTSVRRQIAEVIGEVVQMTE
jgi:hypothetical protein